MSDEADKQAEELLPCLYAHENPVNCGCQVCRLRAAVAAALRREYERGEVDGANDFTEHHHNPIVHQLNLSVNNYVAEIAKLKDRLFDQADTIRRQREELEGARAYVAEFSKLKAELEAAREQVVELNEARQQAEQAAERQRELITIGRMMANLCFNGKQNDAIPERYRENMADLQKRWDAILAQVKP